MTSIDWPKGAKNAHVSFAVVVPMYNEETGAEECVRQICRQLVALSHHSELIVVNDGSTDGTAATLSKTRSGSIPLMVIDHGVNRGYGAALVTGARKAWEDGFDYVLFMDSDLTNDPKDIPKFVEKMREGIDVIKGSRFVSNGGMDGVPLFRRIISILGNLTASLLFRVGVIDCTNGFRAVKSRLLSEMRLLEKGFPIIVEELYHCVFLAKTFAEVPVVLTNRQADQRPTMFSYTPSVFLKYLRYGLLSFVRVKPAALDRESHNVN